MSVLGRNRMLRLALERSGGSCHPLKAGEMVVRELVRDATGAAWFGCIAGTGSGRAEFVKARKVGVRCRGVYK
jgi:hypothetical protein